MLSLQKCCLASWGNHNLNSPCHLKTRIDLWVRNWGSIRKLFKINMGPILVLHKKLGWGS